MKNRQSQRGDMELIMFIFMAIVIITVVVGGLMFVIPKYNVWRLSLKGQAILKQQEYEKLVLIEEARAKKDSAKLLAEAEVERAKGVAQANEIIGQSLKQNDEYLRYLWIQGLQDGTSEVIYVPTEAQLPILEATRKLQPSRPSGAPQ